MKVTTKEYRGSSRAQALIYTRARVLTADGEDRHSEARLASEQVKSCQATAVQLGADVVQEYVDLGVGADDLQRPGLAALMERLAANDIDYVIVSGWDRLTRSAAEHRRIEQAIASNGAEIVVAGPYRDAASSKALDSLLADLTRAIAERYSYEQGLAIRRGRARAKRRVKASSIGS